MINLFRKNMVMQVLLTVAALVALWGKALVAPEQMTDGNAVLYHLLYMGLSSLPRLAVVLAMLLVLAEGVWLNLLLSKVGLVPQTSLLPTLLYVIMMSATSATLTPMIIVSGILIGCTQQLMLRTTLLTIPTDKICSTTALIGLASMFYIPSLAVLLSYLLVVVNYRLYSWRDWMALLLGLLAPYILLVTILLLSDNLTSWWNGAYSQLSGIAAHHSHANMLTYVANTALILALLASILYMWSRLGEHTIVWQKNATSVMLLVVGCAVMLLYSHIFPVDTSLFAIPFALCGFHMLMPEKAMHSRNGRKPRVWVPDAILIIILIAAIVC